MKRCPHCSNNYNDELSYCVVDNTPLISDPPTAKELQADTLNLPAQLAAPQARQKETISSQDCPDKWLHDIAQEDAGNVQKVVSVEGCEIQHELSQQVPHIDFKFTVFNGSVYSISIDGSLEGYILFRKKRLMGSMAIESSFKGMGRGYKGDVVLRLQVSREEADWITGENNPDADYFRFDQLKVKVGGGEYHPKVEWRRLSLPDSVPMPRQPEDDSRKIEYFSHLTSREKEILRNYIEGKTRTQRLRYDEGAVVGLIQADVLYYDSNRAATIWNPGEYYTDINMKLWAWKYLNENLELIQEIT